MQALKCPYCNGSVTPLENDNYICDYCDTVSVLHHTDDEKIAQTKERANKLFLACDFEGAAALYQSVVLDSTEDAEAYWFLALCAYGIQFVEDPATKKRVPTCNRTLYSSILNNEDYLNALECADFVSRSTYEKIAKKIDEIQRGILEIVAKEAAYDVFICYKETDDAGNRTKESDIAKDLYYKLTAEGYRVFYAPVTLQSIAGREYEPYIFAALNSAKVMLAIAFSAAHFNAPWVKNEWSRFLARKARNPRLILASCFNSYLMSANDLPEELSKTQARDLANASTNDLVADVKNWLPLKKETQVSTSDKVSVASLLKRIFIFLEDGDFENASEYCEKVLDIDPECAQAYLGKLLVDKKLRKEADLESLTEPIVSHPDYVKCLRFADEALKDRLEGYAVKVRANKDGKNLQDIERAKALLAEGKFSAAKSVLTAVLQDDDTLEGAHWGMLLVDCECKCDSDLLVRGRPITQNEHFKKAVQTASEKSAKPFRIFERATLFAAHFYLLQEENPNALKARVEEYRAVSDERDPLNDLHDALLTAGGPAAHSPLLFGLYMKFAQVYETKLQEILGDLPLDSAVASPFSPIVEQAEERLAKLYESEQDLLFKELLERLNRCSAQCQEFEPDLSENGSFMLLVEPQKPFEAQFQTSVRFGAPEKGPAVKSERYINLIERLWKNRGQNVGRGRPEVIYDSFLKLYDTAVAAGVPAEMVNASKERFLNHILEVGKSEKANIEYVFKHRPSDASLAWDLLLESTDNLGYFGNDYEENKEYSHFMSASGVPDSYAKAEEICERMEKDLADVVQTPESVRNQNQALYETVLRIAEGKQGEYRNQYEAYLKKVDEHCAAQAAMLRDRLQKMRTKIKSCYAKENTATQIKGIFRAIPSIIALAVSGGIALTALMSILDPQRILEYRSIWYYVVLIGACVVAGAAVLFLLKTWNENGRYSRKRLPYCLPVRILLNGGVGICMTLLSVALVLSVYSSITIVSRLGLVGISEAEELRYLKNFPRANFALEADLDLEGAEISVESFKFKGSFDGQGHTISDFKISYDPEADEDEQEILKENKGTIQSLNLKDAVFKGYALDTNSGTLSEITLTDCVLDRAFCQYSSGDIYSLKMNGVSLVPGEDWQEVESATAFVAETLSTGRIESCELTDCRFSKTLVQTPGDEAPEKVEATPETTEGEEESLFEELSMAQTKSFGGICAYSSGSVVDCKVTNLTVEDLFVTRTFGGIVGEMANAGESTTVTYISGCEADGVYSLYTKLSPETTSNWQSADFYGGGIVGYAEYPVENCTASGSFITKVENTEEHSYETIDVKIGGIVGQSYHTVRQNVSDINVDVDIEAKETCYARIGGVCGEVRTHSFTENAQTGSVNVVGNADFKVAGLVGHISNEEAKDATQEESFASDCVQSGAVSLTLRDCDAEPYVGAFFGEFALDVFRNSYSTGALSLDFEGESKEQGQLNVIGYLPLGPKVENCFFAGRADSMVDLAYSHQFWGATYSNCYTVVVPGNPYTGNDDTIRRISLSEAKDVYFVETTLGWNLDIWQLDDEVFPVLKHTVKSAEETPVE